MSEPLEETVECRVCGHVGKSLARHLKASHGITADEYRAKHGEDAAIRSPATEARRRAGIQKAHKDKPKRGRVKQVPCSVCGVEHDVSAFASALSVCPTCVLKAEDNGHQHFLFPNAFMVDESYRPLYDAMRERDRVKKALIDAAPDLTYFMVRYDEPYEDVSYLRGRLVGAGILAPGGGPGASTLEMFSGSY